MSLESYRKAIEEQRKREGAVSDETEKLATPMEKEDVQQVETDRRLHTSGCRPRKSGSKKLIIWLAIIAIFVVAALKNPSKQEVKDELNTFLVERLNEAIVDNMDDESNSIGRQALSGLTMLLGPSILDKLIQTDVTDYVFFSTFDAHLIIGDDQPSVVSGVVIFGKIIPFKSELKDKLK